MSFLCVQCSTSDDSVEFNSVQELKAHENGGHRNRPKKELPPSPPVVPSATEKKTTALGEVVEYEKTPPIVIHNKPLMLIYKWIGSCPVCNTEVKTIEVELGEKNIEIAFCIHCDEKILQQEVIPLPKKEIISFSRKEETIEKRKGRPKKVVS